MAELQRRLSNQGLDVSIEEANRLQNLLEPYLALQDFPTETLQAIASNLRYRDIVALCLASKRFQENICDDQIFWRALYKRNVSNDISGITDFREAYHNVTLKPVYNHRLNTNVWTRKGYEAMSELIEIDGIYIPAREQREFERQHGPNVFYILQALDHGWTKRVEQLLPFNPSKGIDDFSIYLNFLVMKGGDVHVLDWFVHRYILHDKLDPATTERYITYIRQTAIKNAKDEDILIWSLALSKLKPNEIKDIQHYAAKYGTIVSVKYIVKEFVPDYEQGREIKYSAMNSTVNGVYLYLRSMFPEPESSDEDE